MNEALAGLLRQDRDREDRPFGGWAGEMATTSPAARIEPLRPLVIPPPDWAAEEVEQRRREAVARVREPDPTLHREDTESRPAPQGDRGEAA